MLDLIALHYMALRRVYLSPLRGQAVISKISANFNVRFYKNRERLEANGNPSSSEVRPGITVTVEESTCCHAVRLTFVRL